MDIKRIVHAATRALRITPSSKRGMDEWGWTKQGDSWVGYYRTRLGSWSGVITDRNGIPQLWIRFPGGTPPELNASSHFPCFTRIRDDYFSIHFHPEPRTAEDGVKAVERCLGNAAKTHYRPGRAL